MHSKVGNCVIADLFDSHQFLAPSQYKGICDLYTIVDPQEEEKIPDYTRNYLTVCIIDNSYFKKNVFYGITDGSCMIGNIYGPLFLR